MDFIKKINATKYLRIKTMLEQELNIVNNFVNLIGSANYPFQSCLDALSMPLQMNPAEGKPFKRFYPGCENLDLLESMGEEYALKFFEADNDEYKVSLQPHSGTQANHIVLNAILEPEDVVLAQSTKSGGHISHTVFADKYFTLKEYGTLGNGYIDYESIDLLCEQYEPKLLIAGTSSYPRQINYKILNSICKKHNVLLLADISHTALYVHTGHHISPFGFADFISLTTHKTTRGIRGGILFYKAEFSRPIEFSICPMTQAAPKYNEILAKLMMFIELESMDCKAYVEQVKLFTEYFCGYFISRDKEIVTKGSDMHLVLLDLSDEDITGKEAESRLYVNKILANRNLLANDKKGAYECSGLRCGFLSLVTKEYTMDQFKSLTKKVYDTLFDDF